MTPESTAPPPLTLTGPDGSRVTVAVPSATNTVGELADSLGLPRRSDLLLDGRPVERRLPLDRAEITQGSRLTERPACRGPARDALAVDRRPRTGRRGAAGRNAAPASLVLVVEAGPAAGATIELGAGRHVIGRATSARVHLDDDLVELHHAVVDVRR